MSVNPLGFPITSVAPTPSPTTIQTRNTTSYLTVLGEANVLPNDGGVTQAELTFYNQNLQLQLQYVNNLEQFLGPNAGLNFTNIRTGIQDRMTIAGTVLNNFNTFAANDITANAISGADVFNVAIRDGNANNVTMQDIMTPRPTTPTGQFNFSTNDVFSVARAADSLMGTFGSQSDGVLTPQELQQYIASVGSGSQAGQIGQVLLTNFNTIVANGGNQSLGGLITVGITPTAISQTAALDGNPFNFTTQDINARRV